jgi:ATP-dependent HslUV protease subunit HslV
MLRRLEAMMIVADRDSSLLISGTGDVIDAVDDLIAIGSGGPYAQSAARALFDNTQLDAREIVENSLQIAADICIYTNNSLTIEEITN